MQKPELSCPKLKREDVANLYSMFELLVGSLSTVPNKGLTR